MSTNTRVFSLEEDFMNWNTNDLLYAFMRCLSTAKPEEDSNGKMIKTANGKVKYREYLPLKTFKKNKKIIADICGCTTRTIERQLDKMFEAGILDEGIETVKVNNKEYDYECFWFPYDYDATFKIVDKDVIEYLVHTRNAQAIRIYLYLLNKYQWKKDYVFTIQEIKEALGYSASTKSVDSLIKNVLASFKAEGVIRYEKFYDEVDIGGLNDYKTVPVERMKLKYVATKRAELPNF